MKQATWAALSASLLVAASGAANGALISRLGGLAYYDTEADLTWLADARAASGSVYDTYQVGSGRMNWTDANAWAAGLNINGVTGWRLPVTLQPDATCSGQGVDESYGYDCTGSELGNLFYNVLGGVAMSSIGTTHNANYDLFSNIRDGLYWSATEYAPDPRDAWDFNMILGYQNNNAKTDTLYSYNYAWAVHSGDVGGVSSVPVPGTLWLVGAGLMGLIGAAARRRG